MRGFNSPVAGYLLICGLVAGSLALATLADSQLGSPPPLRAGPLAGPVLGGSGFQAAPAGPTPTPTTAATARANPAVRPPAATVAATRQTSADDTLLQAEDQRVASLRR